MFVSSIVDVNYLPDMYEKRKVSLVSCLDFAVFVLLYLPWEKRIQFIVGISLIVGSIVVQEKERKNRYFCVLVS